MMQVIKVGIMTSVTIDHATPGAFYANSLDRNDYYAVAVQLPQRGSNFSAAAVLEGVKKWVTENLHMRLQLRTVIP